MSRNEEIRLLDDLARRRGCCFWADDASLRKSLRRRSRSGQLANPYMNMYAMRDYWDTLRPSERIRHVVLTLAIRHPSWVFAGKSAAVIERIGIPEETLLDGHIVVGKHTGGGTGSSRKLERIFVPVQDMGRRRKATGLRDLPEERYAAFASTSSMAERLECDVIVNLTTPARTLYDCANQLEFKNALPVFDSALRAGLVSESEIRALANRRHAGQPLYVLKHATSLSESVGESLCRAFLIEQGFSPPELQHVFADPANPSRYARADFMWRQPGERIVVLEFDGMQKFIDPAMTKGRKMSEIVVRQLERDGLLKRAGVTSIVHVTFDDLSSPDMVRGKLLEAGVPQVSD